MKPWETRIDRNYRRAELFARVSLWICVPVVVGIDIALIVMIIYRVLAP